MKPTQAAKPSVPALERLTHRVAVRATWETLALAAPQRTMLRKIIAQARASGASGLRVLLAGAATPNKSRAAQVLARELQLKLYRVDLAAVVSKYIGETEKNLDLVFSAAEASDAVLFFDEADALFGKRTKVKDAHDRYANLDVSYIAQRLQRHCGVVLVAATRKGNLDEAFTRRLRVVVDFSPPRGARA